MADQAGPSTSAGDVPTEPAEESPLNPFVDNQGSVNPTRTQRAAAEARLFDTNPDTLRQLFQLNSGDANGVTANRDSYGSEGPVSRNESEPELFPVRRNRLQTTAQSTNDTSGTGVGPPVIADIPSQRRIVTLTLSDLPKYYGNSIDKVSFWEWLKMVERITNAVRGTDEDRLYLLPALLRDNAYMIYKNVCRQTANNYTAIIEAMRFYLRPSVGPEFYIKYAYSLNQSSTQTVLDFATEIQSVLEQDGIITPDELEPTKLRSFMGGLREDIKLGMKIRDHSDFMLALADAKQAEQFTASPAAVAAKPKITSKSESEKFPNNGHSNNDMKDLLAKFTKELDKITQDSQVNHLASQISQLKPSVPSTQNSQQSMNAIVPYYNQAWNSASAQIQPGYNTTWVNEPTRPSTSSQNFGENHAPYYPPWVSSENSDPPNFQNGNNNFIPPNRQNFNGQPKRNLNWSSGSRNAFRNNGNNQNYHGNNANYNGNNQNSNYQNSNYQNSNNQNSNYQNSNGNFNGNNRNFNTQTFRGNNSQFEKERFDRYCKNRMQIVRSESDIDSPRKQVDGTRTDLDWDSDTVASEATHVKERQVNTLTLRNHPDHRTANYDVDKDNAACSRLNSSVVCKTESGVVGPNESVATDKLVPKMSKRKRGKKSRNRK